MVIFYQVGFSSCSSLTMAGRTASFFGAGLRREVDSGMPEVYNLETLLADSS